MPQIAIMADSSSDIPKQLVQELNIEILPLTVTFGDKVYKDFYDFDNEQFFKLLENSEEMPKTAAVNTDLFYQAFKQKASEGKKIICLTISSAGSSTFQSANIAKNMVLDEMDADIEIVDTFVYSYIFGYAAVEAAKMAIDNKDKSEILSRINDIISNYEIFFMVDTLKYLKKGGRLNPAAALIGEILDIKPILSIKDGVACAIEKVRGKKRLLPRVIELMKQRSFEPQMPVVILYSRLKDAIETGNILKDTLGVQSITNIQLGATIGTHTGPDTVAVIFFRK